MLACTGEHVHVVLSARLRWMRPEVMMCRPVEIESLGLFSEPSGVLAGRGEYGPHNGATQGGLGWDTAPFCTPARHAQLCFDI